MKKKPDLRKIGKRTVLEFMDHTVILTRRNGRKFETRKVRLQDLLDNNLFGLGSYFKENND